MTFLVDEGIDRGKGVVVAPLPSAADIASCSHVVSSNVNEVDAIGTGLPVEIVDCESGSIDVASAELVVGNDVEFGLIDVVSAELVVGNVVARNVSKLLVNVELVAGVVEASTAVIVDVPSIMPDQSIPAFPMASTEVMEPTKTAREASKGVADLMQQLKKNSKKSGTKERPRVVQISLGSRLSALARLQIPSPNGYYEIDELGNSVTTLPNVFNKTIHLVLAYVTIVIPVGTVQRLGSSPVGEMRPKVMQGILKFLLAKPMISIAVKPLQYMFHLCFCQRHWETLTRASFALAALATMAAVHAGIKLWKIRGTKHVLELQIYWCW
ncbi:hypothetical protein V6N11_060402 [Hibiscus sabdariffa]|uniref:Uncharacterized protein n=1 Tax=Hibiscus sabdariffa TaxID=183260 RepID=A0ABR2QQ74_9ROSI